jgi:phospholipid N-methyltransferase
MDKFIDLLNTNGIIDFSNVDFMDDISEYNKSLINFENYEPQPTLLSWRDSKHIYPNLDPRHRYIVDTIKENNYKKIIDLGAGAGCVSKPLYHEYGTEIEELVCVEHNKTHFKQMLDNFDNQTHVVPPDIKVKSNTINKDILETLKSYSDNYFDVGFTCTVLMHIPYILAVQIIKEISRVCKNVIHTENQNDLINCVIKGKTNLTEQYCCINYPLIYNKLNFNIKQCDFVKDPYVDNCYYVYLHANKKI